jgi:hypothetical protein
MGHRHSYRLISGVITLVGFLALTGCASSMMQPAAPQSAPSRLGRW